MFQTGFSDSFDPHEAIEQIEYVNIRFSRLRVVFVRKLIRLLYVYDIVVIEK